MSQPMANRFVCKFPGTGGKTENVYLAVPEKFNIDASSEVKIAPQKSDILLGWSATVLPTSPVPSKPPTKEFAIALEVKCLRGFVDPRDVGDFIVVEITITNASNQGNQSWKGIYTVFVTP